MINEPQKQSVHVILIDSGIESEDTKLKNCIRTQTAFRLDDKGSISEDSNIKVTHPHGTAIAAVIHYLCPNIEFTSINILDEELNSDGRLLIHALKYSLNYKPDIIHLSLGTTNIRYFFKLKRIIKAAELNNILIVAAANNFGIKCYPAHIKGVFPVKSDHSIYGREFYYKDNFFFAPHNMKNIPKLECIKNQWINGTSIAAAYITGHAAGMKLKNKNLDNVSIREMLMKCK